MTHQILSAALLIPLARAAPFAEPLAAAMAGYAVDTPVRRAAFLAQCGHESVRLQWLRELWGPTPARRAYEPLAAKVRARRHAAGHGRARHRAVVG